MTALGEILHKRSVNRSEVARRTGLSYSRLSELAINPKVQPRVYELYMIALATEINPHDLMDIICRNFKLRHLSTRMDERRSGGSL